MIVDERMASSYVQAIYEFRTKEPGEISLAVGDVVHVIKHVDANWMCGELNGQFGNFPASFIQPLHVPPIQHGQKLFLANRTFPAEVQGDLGFQKG